MPENLETHIIKRKRGGQPGNLNAFKHGLSCRGLDKLEREELKARIILTALEQAQALMREKITELHAKAQASQAFVVAKTAPANDKPLCVKGAVKAFVLLDRSRLEGFVDLKIHITMPVPEILTSQAKLMESILKMRADSLTNNESPQAP